MSPPLFQFVPLGGSGEIGINMNLYRHGDAWIMVDCGMGFEKVGGDTRVIVPDPRFAADLGGDLLALVITHIHLDHLGAVDALWRRLRCPVHATPFAAAVLRQRLREARLEGRVPIHEHPVGERFQIGPFDLETVALTHSTWESTGLAIRTPSGTVFHTGDYKLDDDPVLGPVTDATRLAQLGDEGVSVVVGDSTNATHDGHSRSEAEVAAELDHLIGQRRGRVAVATFSSHIARLHTLARLARQHGREPVLLGRSMHRMVQAAHEVDLMTDVGPFLDVEDACLLPRDEVLFILTGTQAEPRSALDRIAQGTHRDIALEKGDTVIFSSKIIPGNEDPIARLHDRLRAQGLEVIHELDNPRVHASGHPCRDELRTLYGWLRPDTVIPVHGEPEHLTAHAELARSEGMHALEVRNGDIVDLASQPPCKLPHPVHHGRIMQRR